MKDFDPEKFIDKYKLPIAIVLSICATVSAFIFFQRNKVGEEEIRFLTQEEIKEVKGLSNVDLEAGKIQVDIEGQVNNPGVVEIEQGAILFDLIEKAGGFSENADMYYVHKNLNLAEELEDRAKYYIPSIDESSSSAGQAESAEASTGLVNINTASAEELDTLPGIGPSTADKIIGARPFGAIEDIMDVSGIGESTFEKIKDKISV